MRPTSEKAPLDPRLGAHRRADAGLDAGALALRHAAEEWNAMRASNVAPKAFQQKASHFGRDAVFQALGFFVRA